MTFADALNMLAVFVPLLALLALASLYLALNPPCMGRFMNLWKRNRRRREMLRWMHLLLALCCMILLALIFYDLIAGKI
jgi:uncharacterized membrane protein